MHSFLSNNALSSAPSLESKAVRSTLVSRNITVATRRTSIRLEPEMWAGLTEICQREHTKLHTLCTMIARQKSENTSLTAAIRVFIMGYYRAAATEDGHTNAGHGQSTSHRPIAMTLALVAASSTLSKPMVQPTA